MIYIYIYILLYIVSAVCCNDVVESTKVESKSQSEFLRIESESRSSWSESDSKCESFGVVPVPTTTSPSTIKSQTDSVAFNSQAI